VPIVYELGNRAARVTVNYNGPGPVKDHLEVTVRRSANSEVIPRTIKVKTSGLQDHLRSWYAA